MEVQNLVPPTEMADDLYKSRSPWKSLKLSEVYSDNYKFCTNNIPHNTTFINFLLRILVLLWAFPHLTTKLPMATF